MLEDSIRYQTQGEDWLKRVGIGGGVVFVGLFLGILLFPLVLLLTLQGYMLEVMRRVLAGDTENPPEWGELDLVETTIDGLRHYGVIIPYTLVALLLAGIPFGGLFLIGALAGIDLLVILAWLVGGLLYFVAIIAAAVVIPVATGNFVRKDSIAAGFDLGVLRTLVTNRTMLKAVLIAFGVNIIASAVGSALGFTIIGLLAVPWVQFVFQSAVFYVWADGFADAYEEEYGEPPLAGTTESGTDDPTSPAEEPV